MISSLSTSARFSLIRASLCSALSAIVIALAFGVLENKKRKGGGCGVCLWYKNVSRTLLTPADELTQLYGGAVLGLVTAVCPLDRSAGREREENGGAGAGSLFGHVLLGAAAFHRPRKVTHSLIAYLFCWVTVFHWSG